MEQTEQKTITIPAKLNLFDVVTVKPYYGSPEYNEANTRFQANVKRQKAVKRTVNIILWLMLAAFLAYLHFTGHTFLIWVAGILGVIICGINSSVNSPNSISSYFDITKENEEICKKVIDELMQTYFPESRYINAWGNALIYNNDVFAYISVAEGLLVLYKHDNYKLLDCKGVNGSHDFGEQFDLISHGSVATITYKGKGYKKEIRIEISTDYIAYPIFRFNVPDTPRFREELKIASSVLS